MNAKLLSDDPNKEEKFVELRANRWVRTVFLTLSALPTVAWGTCHQQRI